MGLQSVDRPGHLCVTRAAFILQTKMGKKHKHLMTKSRGLLSDIPTHTQAEAGRSTYTHTHTHMNAHTLVLLLKQTDSKAPTHPG